MENATTFNEAVEIFKTRDLIAPAYFIIGGVNPGEGAIITRNQFNVADVWMLNDTDSWYILETNYDHWLPPPSDDDRQTPGMKALNSTTQANINYETVFDVLSINPVCNKCVFISVIFT